MMDKKLHYIIFWLSIFIFSCYSQESLDRNLQNILSLMEERMNKIALIDSVWECNRELFPDPYLQKRWRELAEKDLQSFLYKLRSLGLPEPSHKELEDYRKRYYEIYYRMAHGFQENFTIFFKGGQSLILAQVNESINSHSLTLFFFFFLKDRSVLRYYNRELMAIVSLMNEKIMPIFSPSIRWFFIGGNILNWLDNYSINQLKREEEEAILILTLPKSQEVSEARISLKYDGAPISLIKRKRQKVSQSIQSKDFLKIGEVWIPTSIVEETTFSRIKYRLISAQKSNDPRKVHSQLPYNIHITDIRLGLERQVHYKFKGNLPSLEELERIWQEYQKLRQKFQKQRTIKNILQLIPPLILAIVGIILYSRVRKVRKFESNLH